MGLFGDAGGGSLVEAARGDHLLARVTVAHASDDCVQATVLWLVGLAFGVAMIVQQMAQQPACHAVQLAGVRTLGLLYGDRVDFSAADMEAVPAALGAVVGAMAVFPDNLILQQHACYALHTMAEQGALCSEASGRVADGTLVECLAAAARALGCVRGRSDGGYQPCCYNALYLRKEATRCIVAVCAAKPQLGRWLRERGLHEVLADALRSTAESVMDGRRDVEAEEVMRLELLALSYALGPATAILETLRRWGATKPAVARAVADAIVELARGELSRGRAASDPSDPAAAALAAPAQTLRAAGCGMELMAVMQAHADDDDLQGRISLAVGFIGHSGVCAA